MCGENYCRKLHKDRSYLTEKRTIICKGLVHFFSSYVLKQISRNSWKATFFSDLIKKIYERRQMVLMYTKRVVIYCQVTLNT